ncbi:hypothetical protein MNBD_ALPHA12-1921 [hydrothermal vent metagenome]|uniref:BioF2-like acetyltransferase domain-containing protein n=1 Tax=hydrothermal vent metagenome TaxID=652676 RepID=A0A3B0TN35_9ZZZZ
MMVANLTPLVQSGRVFDQELKQHSSQTRVLDFTLVSGEVWDKSVAGFDGVAQEQLYVFAKSRWPAVKCEPNLFYQNGKIVGGVLVMIQPLPFNLASLAVAKWGPVMADNQRADGEKIYALMIETLIAHYADNRAMMLSVLPRASIGKQNPALKYLRSRGFCSGSTLMFPNRYIVNLSLSEQEQRQSFAQKWRYHLNKSLKQGLSFERAPASRIDQFKALYDAMSERKKFADHSAYATIGDLMAVEEEKLRPELFFVLKGKEIVAGAIVFSAGDTAVYLYGATNSKALPLRAGYFLQYNIIRWLSENTRARWYDLGGTDGFQGLHQFKKGMVGKRGHISPVPPVMNYASHLRAQIFGSLAYWARERVQNLRHLVERARADMATPDQER